ncbi:MAG TPA: HAD family hydrolase [Bryobacteraceae bacterium]
MRYIALATDYDGTLAHEGLVSADTVKALECLRQSGRKLLLVTGRELPDLESIFPRLDLFDRVVAENGALLFNPQSKQSRTLAEPPPPQFVETLRQRGVPEVRCGAVIVAMWRPHEHEAIAAIRELGLELQVIFNKDAVMILPSGVNKMTGLVAALRELRISPHNVVGIGDAENDHAFLGCCECAVVVANAIPALCDKADLITQASCGEGVVELIDRLLADDLAGLAARLSRHDIPLGTKSSDAVALKPFGTAVLVCGHSASGKSSLVAGVMERLAAKRCQVCLIDPEGDFEEAEEFLATGDPKHAPSLDHLQNLLSDPEAQVTVNMVGVPVDERAGLFGRVLALVHESRMRTGRPHWLVVDEAHHMFPGEWAANGVSLAGDHGSALLVTVHPEHVSPPILREINAVIAVGRQPATVIAEFCKVAGKDVPATPEDDLAPGEALLWTLDASAPVRITTEPAHMAHERHKRKYAEGKLEEARVFYFHGPEKRLNLRAQNLTVFMQTAAGIDDETWLFHLRRGDYSQWLREAIRDAGLAEEVERVEKDESLSPADSRSRVAHAIAERYTAPT